MGGSAQARLLPIGRWRPIAWRWLMSGLDSRMRCIRHAPALGAHAIQFRFFVVLEEVVESIEPSSGRLNANMQPSPSGSVNSNVAPR